MLWLCLCRVFKELVYIEQTVSEDKQLQHCTQQSKHLRELHDVSWFCILFLNFYVNDQSFHFHRSIHFNYNFARKIRFMVMIY